MRPGHLDPMASRATGHPVAAAVRAMRHLDAETCLSKRANMGVSVALDRSSASARSWPGRAKAEFKLAAVNQSSKAAQWGKF
jgi:hypothetical protein